eukprot:5107222-Pleurochrysis_carterae.AAC.1
MARLPGAPAHGRLPTPPDCSAASRCPAYKYPYAACWPPRPARCLARHSCTPVSYTHLTLPTILLV